MKAYLLTIYLCRIPVFIITLILALIVLKNSDIKTLPLGLRNMIDVTESSYGMQFAFVLLTIIPAILVISLFSRYMIRGISAGAIKG